METLAACRTSMCRPGEPFGPELMAAGSATESMMQNRDSD